MLGSTQSVIATGNGFMEGCYHFFCLHNAEWDDTDGHQLMSTGTQDYFNNGFYFVDSTGKMPGEP